MGQVHKEGSYAEDTKRLVPASRGPVSSKQPPYIPYHGGGYRSHGIHLPSTARESRGEGGWVVGVGITHKTERNREGDGSNDE